MCASSASPGHFLLEMRGVHKRFTGTHALRGVDFDLRRGEVHALLGENGAGKSTLMHLLAGVYRPDAGTIALDGVGAVTIADEQHAQRLGVAIVYQERSLFGLLSVAENIYAARPPVNRWGMIDRRRLRAEARRALAELGLDIDPDLTLDRLSAVQQQMVEIAKALSLDARLLILDEPTAALTETETAAMFRVIDRLKQRGVGVIYISHRLDEVFRIADRVTVLRDGESRGTFPVADTTPDDLVARVVGGGGGDLRREQTSEHIRAPGGAAEVALEVRGLCARRSTTAGRVELKDVSFQARAGEILALAGLAGAGRTESALAIFGAGERDRGEISVRGERVDIRSPRDAVRAGLGYLPEERKEAGLFLGMSIAENVAAARLGRFGRWWTNDRRRDRVAGEYCRQLRVGGTPDVKRVVQNLSGGNQQKIVLAKWLLVNPAVLIVDEPTRGIDVGAKAEVHDLIRRLAAQGTAIVLISSDLPEVLTLADRVLVMREGRVAGELSRPEATPEKIMRFASCAA